MADPDAARLAWVERLAGVYDDEDNDYVYDEPDTLDWQDR